MRGVGDTSKDIKKKLNYKDIVKVLIYIVRQDAVEFIKYSRGNWTFLLSVCLYAKSRWHRSFGNWQKYIEGMSKLFRSGWVGSFSIVTKECQEIFVSCSNIEKKENIISLAIENTAPSANTEKFFLDPKELFEGVLIVLRSPERGVKGVILIKYSYYFTLMFKLFNMKELARLYHIVLEPSWAGFADISILAYTSIGSPVFIMTYESRDEKFIRKLESNLVPISIGPSWWVNHDIFTPSDGTYEKKYDLVMVASWDPFKRHQKVFKVLKSLKESGVVLKVALAGYSVGGSKDRVIKLALFYGIQDQLVFFEKIPPKKVSELFRSSKLNILWSRFEGNNRSIIEGMFCDVPVLIRKGHNFGEEYSYINPRTGMFVEERKLGQTILEALSNRRNFHPRSFVMKNMSFQNATRILADKISEYDDNLNTSRLAYKTNELDGMKYYDPADKKKFQYDYQILKGFMASK